MAAKRPAVRHARCCSVTPPSRGNVRKERHLHLEHLEPRQLLATISGQVFNDFNADGLKDAGEPGQSGWTIYLDADGNGQLDTGETSTTTQPMAATVSMAWLRAPIPWPKYHSRAGSRRIHGATAPAIERVSLASDGTQGNATFDRYPCSISADGRYVAFASIASNLVPGDTNGVADVFVYDRQTDTIERVSVAADGTQGNEVRRFSLDQRRRPLCGVSLEASNLVPGDTNGKAGRLRV